MGCHHAPTPKAVAQETPAQPSYALAIPADRTVDDLARYLAGMPGQAGSAFKAAEETPVWKLHPTQSDLGWNRFLNHRQPLMRDFTKASIAFRLSNSGLGVGT